MSTLIQLLACAVEPDEGKLTIGNGVTFGFAPEKPDLPEHLLVGEWLDTVAALRRTSAENPLFGVESLRRRPIKMLSLGQRQRVSLASAWLGSPQFLVLEEPTNGLDQETRTHVMDRIQAPAETIDGSGPWAASSASSIRRRSDRGEERVRMRLLRTHATEPPPNGVRGSSTATARSKKHRGAGSSKPPAPLGRDYDEIRITPRRPRRASLRPSEPSSSARGARG